MAAIAPEESIKSALSAARIGTYEAATTVVPSLDGALALYAWNSQVSAAMLSPLHMCEVVIRNAEVNKDLNQIRTLRNRIAHHEPIIKRILSDDFRLIEELIGFRCPVTAAWMVQHQQAQPFFGIKPS